ncbi:MAG TPA: hypothetical protein VN948_04455 [Terriglobales bacterium]|nr:hypothetical protein [Terriglobales bacterium]
MPQEVTPTTEPQAGVDMSPPIDVKDAVRLAMENFKEMFGNPFLDLSLEEVSKGPQGQWLVTLGYTMARSTPGGLAPIPNYPRMYKQVSIDGTTGQVISMKVWKF